MYSLTILIPTHNGLQHLQRCLPSVHAHAPAATQVIVVDDASTDDTIAWVTREYPQFEVLRLAANRGFCHAVNAGLRCARGEVIELLNNDTEVCAGWAQAALRHFADPHVGSVAPLVRSMDDPGQIDSCGQDYHLCGWAIARGYRQAVGPRFLTAREVFGASGSSGFYRRSALQHTGGMLPEYEAYLEDTDLAFRLRWAGYRCLYEPASQVLHRGSASYGRQSERVVRLLARNEEFNFWMNLPLDRLLLGLVPHLGFLLVRALSQARRGTLRPFLHGKLQALALWRLIQRRRRETHRLRPARCEQDVPICQDAAIVRDGLRWLLHQQCR